MARKREIVTEIDRILYLDATFEEANAVYAENPLNYDNLIKFGSALIELSMYQKPGDSVGMLEAAISKFDEAFEVNPRGSEAMWCSGNAYRSLSFFIPDYSGEYLSYAVHLYTIACELEPDNQLYAMSLELTAAEAPEVEAKSSKQGVAEQNETAEAQTSSSSSSSSST